MSYGKTLYDSYNISLALYDPFRVGKTVLPDFSSLAQEVKDAWSTAANVLIGLHSGGLVETPIAATAATLDQSIESVSTKTAALGQYFNPEVVTSFEPEWLDPRVTLPPAGSQVNLLTAGGVQVEGVWKEDAKFLAWSPRLKMKPWLKQRLGDAYKKNYAPEVILVESLYEPTRWDVDGIYSRVVRVEQFRRSDLRGRTLARVHITPSARNLLEKYPDLLSTISRCLLTEATRLSVHTSSLMEYLC